MHLITNFFKKLSKHPNIEILIIIIFAFIIRIAGIVETPPSLNWDEVSHGYNAYSILKTGSDEWGNILPTIFRAYGDYKLPVYIYITAISEFIFGLNAFAVRLPSVIAGTLTVLFTYLLSKRLSTNKEVPFVASFLVALEPWSFFVSRAAFEANLALLFIVSGTYFYLSKRFITSVVLFGLSVWTYNSARIFTPLLVFLLIVIYRKEVFAYAKNKTRTILLILIAAIFFVPMLIQLVNPTGQARYTNVAILDEGAIASIEESRNTSSLPSVLTKTIHNRPVYFAKEFTKNYINHLSPNYLFLNGASDYQFSVPGWGMLYLVNLPLFYIGIFICIKNIKQKNYQLLLAWLLISPIASSITRESPHVLRSITMLPIPMILSSIVINKKPKLLSVFALGIFISFVIYLSNYVTDYRKDYSWSWQYGYEQAVGYAMDNYDSYDKIVVSKKYGEPHEFFLFYSKWDPNAYKSDSNLNRFFQSNWFWVDSFDKFYFVNDWEIPQFGETFVLESKEVVNCSGQRCMLITSETNRPLGWDNLEIIRFFNGNIAFEIYENK